MSRRAPRKPLLVLGVLALSAGAALLAPPSEGTPRGFAAPAGAQAASAEEPGVASRPLRLSDYWSLVRLGSPEFSPDGRHVVFESRRIEREEDRWVGSLEIVDPETGQVRRLVESGRSPRFSPDGSLLGFLSARDGETQVWALPTTGGEAWRVTDLPRGVSDFAWAPTSDRVVVVSEEPPSPAPTPTEVAAGEIRSEARQEQGRRDEGDDEEPLPLVITRLQFKQDGTGYIGPRRDHLHVVDVPDDPREAPAEAVQITDGPYDDAAPAWSPDGRWIAFQSNRSDDPELNIDSDVWLVSPEGGELVRVTTDPGGDARPRWSPDGGWILYVHTPAERPVYGVPWLSMVPVGSGSDPAVGDPVPLTRELDRWVVRDHAWAPDGSSVLALIDDRGSVPAIRVSTGLDADGRRIGVAGSVSAVVAGPREVHSLAPSPDGGRLAVVLSTSTRPPELYLAPAEPVSGVELPVADVEEYLRPTPRPADEELRQLTRANAAIAELDLAAARPVHYTSADGTAVEGWYLPPPEGDDDGPLPLIVRAHGGPVGQYTWGFSFEFQLYAAEGYAVLYTNPRGSSGYGLEYSRAIWADWGTLDLQDVEAGVEHLVERGIGDPERVGIGGWSYGGIMTNAAITRSDLFSAAVSGAAEGDSVSAYGTDDIQWWWEAELGLPWENLDAYMRNSPIHDVARVTAPTLFIVGAEDWRQPLSNVEEFYARLRRRMYDGGPETGLIVYPGESHGISRPSFLIDRMRRNVAWYDRHLLGDPDADALYGERAW